MVFHFQSERGKGKSNSLIQLMYFPALIHCNDFEHLVAMSMNCLKSWKTNPHYFCSLKRINELPNTNLWIIAL